VEPLNLKWAVGVTVAPRKEPTIDYCYGSFLCAGFRPHVFKEPGVSLHPNIFKNGFTERPRRLGAWKNWLYGLKELREKNPDADIYGMFQDDVLLCKNIRSYLEINLPPENTGVFSVFTPSHYKGQNRWNMIDKGVDLWMAQTFFFYKDALDSLLSNNIIRGWNRDRNIDSKVGEWANSVGRPVYYHTPSLGQHVGHSSTIWEGSNPEGIKNLPAWGDRSASDFVGHKFDIMQLLYGV
jgi:hypothetical protein